MNPICSVIFLVMLQHEAMEVAGKQQFIVIPMDKLFLFQQLNEVLPNILNEYITANGELD